MTPISTYDRCLQEAAEARDAGRLDEAERLWTVAAQADPAAAEPHHHLGVTLEASGRLAEAETEYRAALMLAPAAEATARLLGRLLLSQGRYGEGFPFFEARHTLAGMTKPALPFPEWRGEDLAGKRLLIWPEQGFGDQIQFARFAPVLEAQGAEVTLVCRPALVRLFQGCLGVRVLGAAGAIDFPDPDYWVMTCSLAWRMGVEPDALPSEPYLHAVERSAAVGGKVGVVANGNPSNANDANRSLGDEDRARLLSLATGAVDLDPSATGARDFADTAAIIAELDLVICVDTAVAHLAGAMGKPCWVLIPAANTDWRWGREGRTTPWYPSLKLYRQRRPGDWSTVLDEIDSDLRALL